MIQARTLSPRPVLAALLAVVALLAFTVAGADAKTLKLKGDDTALALDSGTAGALTGAGYSVTPYGAAQARDDGSIAFPITGGRVNAKTLAGYITHSGGLTIAKGNASVTVRNFTIVTNKGKPFVSARAGKSRIRLLNLSGIERSDSGGKVIVTADAKLAKPAAKALNRAFHTSLFKGGLRIGTATVTASA